MRFRLIATALVLSAAVPCAAQRQFGDRAERFLSNCERNNGNRDRERFCEVRDVTVRAPSGALTVDGRENGGVSFVAGDGKDVRVKALIEANADSRADAQSIAREIRVQVDGDRIHADGPMMRRHESWSVSYEISVPRTTNLRADTHNGGISVDGVEGRMTLHATNGGISVRDVAGDVRATTTNGGVNAILSGGTWKGDGLDLETTNGGVTLEVPRGYNARLETGTVNGSMHINFPITVSGRLGRSFSTTLGQGGPLVRMTTTNGGVTIRER
jgi:DUF4097 and DUF4098 domain-containing protein YvlB